MTAIADPAISCAGRQPEVDVSAGVGASLGVIILNWNNTADTLACLNSIVGWSRTKPRVWVVDNGSADGMPAVESALGGLRVMRNQTNLGFAGGNNLALAEALQAKCAYILLLNNDAHLGETDLEQLIEVMSSDPTIGVIGPLLCDAQEPKRLLSAGGRDIAYHAMSHERDIHSDASLKRVAYVPGTVALIRSALLEQIGLLDEQYFFGGELADLCERALCAGYQSVIHTGTQARHDLQRSSRMRDSLHAYYVIRNRFLFIRKHRANKRLWLFVYWSIYGLAMSAASWLRDNPRRTRALRLGVWHGLLGRFGDRNQQVWPDLEVLP